ncbi:alkaline phosphatase PhoX [Parerythrobacter aestuarii]|uniref:alkaline phosphatase PhoX n=1 Tax=Parerythrobacter aestuarii TaxID=3020909 RepID=UPI0024DEBEAB|nr:alkaline phosphatase PhoX [Parerythrobacter aestuarii]
MSAPFQTDRRAFMTATSSAFAALIASGCSTGPRVAASATNGAGYGPLVPDPAGLLDLPAGFSYRVISRLGDAMDDGLTVPDRGDGMGCFDLGNGEIALVRNHELHPGTDPGGELASGYGRGPDGKVFPGGTTNVVLDAESLEVKRQFRSLAGTMRNCSGGITPWNSWITCEEPGSRALALAKEHGYAFEVPADAPGMVDPVPLKAMGRFNHEAACVDPVTGMVYMTEDQDDGLVYRFIPNVNGELAKGGKLQALALEKGFADASNRDGAWKTGDLYMVRWIDLDDVEAPDDDLRKRGAAAGATTFSRGEGMHMGERELFFCCTSGGQAGYGQIFRLRPGRTRVPDTLDLYFESTGPEQFNYGDNLCVAPNSHLVVCEDQYTDVVDNHLRGIDRQGRPYDLARLDRQTELAGACFSPDGKTMFVNAYSPTVTLAITGPWAS